MRYTLYELIPGFCIGMAFIGLGGNGERHRLGIDFGFKHGMTLGLLVHICVRELLLA